MNISLDDLRQIKMPEDLGGLKKLNLDKSIEMLQKTNDEKLVGFLGIRRPELFVYGEYPVFFDRAGQGMHVIDVDENEYIDYQAGWGPIVLSFANEEVNKAVYERTQKGFCFSTASPIKVKLEEKLKEIIPCAESVILAKTGSDVTAMAVRAARAYTGKNKILSHGFHGWHDWSIYDKSDTGVPKENTALTIEIPWGDLEVVENYLKTDDDIAGIFITAIYHEVIDELKASKDYLEGIRKLSDKYKVVFIMDEIRTGFRIAIGGAGEVLGVKPDLACFGKAMGNGYPISALCGKFEILEPFKLNKTFISSTFFPNANEAEAALKVIEIMEREDVMKDIAEKSDYFEKKAREIVQKHNLPIIYAGYKSMPYFVFRMEEQEKFVQATLIFYTCLVRLGIIMHPFHHGYISYGHTYDDLDKTLRAVDNALAIMEQMM